MQKKLLAMALGVLILNPAFSNESLNIGEKLQANTGGLAGVSELSDSLSEGLVLRVDESSSMQSQYCFDAFPNGVMPLVYSQKIYDNTIMLCNSGYVTTVNQETKTPVYAAEYLNQSMVMTSAQVEQKAPTSIDYKRETRLPESYQVLIDNYNSLLTPNSLYAMGELVPPIMQGTELERVSTFRLSNIVPINRKLKEGLLKSIDDGLRKYIYQTAKEGYLVSGTYYEGSSYRIGDVNGAAVPAYIYKAFYFPSLGIASAYWIKNDEVSTFDVISIAELKKRTKVDVFPDVPLSVKQKLVYPPRPYKGDDSYLGDLRRLDDLNIDDFLQEKSIKGTELKTAE